VRPKTDREATFRTSVSKTFSAAALIVLTAEASVVIGLAAEDSVAARIDSVVAGGDLDDSADSVAEGPAAAVGSEADDEN
jgi:hypothetical protein